MGVQVSGTKDGKAWRLARSLIELERQFDNVWPARSLASDGSIGYGADASMGSASDHNPWFADAAGVGVVSAVDVTEDPGVGVDCDGLAAALAAAQDPRVKYAIWDYHMLRSYAKWVGGVYYPSWSWAPYSGDPHTSHLHLSVQSSVELYDAPEEWSLVAPVLPLSPFAAGEVSVSQLKPGVVDSDSVRRLQFRLNRVVAAGLPLTGNYADQTVASVKVLQAVFGVAPTGTMTATGVRRLFTGSACTVIP